MFPDIKNISQSPVSDRQTHTIIEPPTGFTVDTRHSALNVSPRLRRTKGAPYIPKTCVKNEK